MSERQPIEETEIFRLFDEVSDWTWNVSVDWDWFAKKVIGAQLITSADSVVSNLVEGDGRYRPNDALHFFTIARGSARETRLWIHKAVKRKLVEPTEGLAQIEKVESASKQLNKLIEFRRRSESAIAKEDTSSG